MTAPTSGGSWTGIDGENTSSYTVTEDDLGKFIRVAATKGEKTVYAVTEAAVAEAEVENPSLTKVDQTGATELELAFDGDVSEYKGTDFSVTNNANDVADPVISFEPIGDGTAGILILGSALTDGATYTVAAKDSEMTFVAQVGDVESIIINTTQAQANVDTKIDFAFYDAEGIDVTSAVNVDTTTIVTVSGTYNNFQSTTASNSVINMSTVGDEAQVTITYNSGASGADDVIATGTIICVTPNETVGAARFKGVTTGAYPSFYLGTEKDDSSIGTSVDSTKTFAFCAQEDLSDYRTVIDYDEYNAESANEDIALVSINKGAGKWAEFAVQGVNAGTTSVIVTATENGVDTKYVVPVTVAQSDAAVKLTLEVTRSTMSNAVDNDYYGDVYAYFQDKAGNYVEVDSYEVKYLNEDNYKVDANAGANGDVFKDMALGTYGKVTRNDHTAYHVARYKAAGAAAGTYTIQVSGTDDNYVMTKNATINVRALPKDFWDATKSVSFTYTIDLSADSIKLSKGAAGTISSQMMASVNNLFAGYVTQNVAYATTAGNTAKIGDYAGAVAKPTAATAISTVSANGIAFDVFYGTDSTTGGAIVNGDVSVNLYQINQTTVGVSNGTDTKFYRGTKTDANGATLAGYDALTGLDSTKMVMNLAATGTTYYVDNPEYDVDFARPGTYTVKYKYIQNGKEVVKTNTFKVVNDLFIPKVAVRKSTVTSSDAATVKEEALTDNYDMNKDEGLYTSITDVRSGKIDSTGDRTMSGLSNVSGAKYSSSYVNVTIGTLVYWIKVAKTFTVG